MHVETAISLGTLVTCVGALIRYASSHGSTLQVIKEATQKLDGLVDRIDHLAHEHNEQRIGNATREQRLLFLEKRMELMEERMALLKNGHS